MQVKIDLELPKQDESLKNRIAVLERSLAEARKDKKDSLLSRRLAAMERLLGKLPELVNGNREKDADRIVSALDRLEMRMSKFSLQKSPTIKVINTDTRVSSAIDKLDKKLNNLSVTPPKSEGGDNKLLSVLNRLETKLLKISSPSPIIIKDSQKWIPYAS